MVQVYDGSDIITGALSQGVSTIVAYINGKIRGLLIFLVRLEPQLSPKY
jgi:hypothetical protein